MKQLEKEYLFYRYYSKVHIKQRKRKKIHSNYTSKLEGNKIHLIVQVIYNNKTKDLEKIYWENIKKR